MEKWIGSEREAKSHSNNQHCQIVMDTLRKGAGGDAEGDADSDGEYRGFLSMHLHQPIFFKQLIE